MSPISGSDTKKRLDEIAAEMAMFERMKDPAYKCTIHAAGFRRIAELKAERAELVKNYQ